jgi:ceramide glucosyltransferase
VNDGDIKVTPGYLGILAARLEDPAIGLVTCPYRAWAHSAPGNWEALGIAADFMLGVLVADMLGLHDYGLGATLAFRASDLKAIGGFEAIADFIADDYQIGHRLAKQGKPALLCPYTVETTIGDDTWAGVWSHQVRWARTIRVSKPGSYLGLPIAFGGLWGVVAAAAGAWTAAGVILLFRWLSALVSTIVLRNARAARFFWLAPLWDLYASAIWATSYLDDKVRWRDRVLRIARDGRIVN